MVNEPSVLLILLCWGFFFALFSFTFCIFISSAKMFFFPKFSEKNPECKKINGTTFTDASLDLLSILTCDFLVYFWFSLFMSISKRPVSHAASVRGILSCLGLDSSLWVTYHMIETLPPYLTVLQRNCTYLFIGHWNAACNFTKNQIYVFL